MQRYKVEALWDCIYCGKKGLKGGNRDCINCGHTRGAEVQFYLPQNVDLSQGVDESEIQINSRPDWMCNYCRAYNSADRERCKNCGASRDNTTLDYINIHTKKSKRND